MEDFNSARADKTTPEMTAFQSEWLQCQEKPDTCLSFVSSAKDKQEPVNEKKAAAAAKDTAESLDKELKEFAEEKLANPSKSMQRFQKAVGKFCDASDKESAMQELGDTWSALSSQYEMKAGALYRATKSEADNTAGRKELVDGHKAKQDQFWDKVFAQPLQESFRIQDLMMRQAGESKAEQQERIQKGLANNKPVLDAYKQILAAEAKIEANKGPREKQLEELRSQLDAEDESMRLKVEKAYIRSTIKN